MHQDLFAQMASSHSSQPASPSPPTLVRLHFLKDSDSPQHELEKCKTNLKKWKEGSLVETPPLQNLQDCQKRMVAKLIWRTNLLEDTLPGDVKEEETISILEKIYKSNEKEANNSYNGSASGIEQLVNHTKALEFLLSHIKSDLTEEIILKTHEIMMKGLTTEEGSPIHNGKYRQYSVCAGFHTFPLYTCIPNEMGDILKAYNDRMSMKDHDPIVLATWVYYHVVSLHPFEDGNGRMSRLLWCYSLMKDGLPFPPLLTSGHKKSQKHLVSCLQKDRDLFYSNQPHTTTLTVVSLSLGWNDFLDTLKSFY